MILYYLQKALIWGVLLGVVYFLSTTFLHSEVRFLFPYSQCNAPELSENTQAGSDTHTLAHALCFPQNCTHGKENLDSHGTVKLSIKSQTNDVSSPLYLFKGKGELSYTCLHTDKCTQRVISDHQLHQHKHTPDKMCKYFGFT